MRYWDTSALIALVVREADTARREVQLREDGEIVTWWATRVECASAIGRLMRAGDLAPEHVAIALRKLEILSAGWTEVQPSDRVRTRAMRLLRVHPLRAADALQLAAGLAVHNECAGALVFLSADERLRVAAEKEGLDVR